MPALTETTEVAAVTTPADWFHFLFGTVESGWITLFSIDRTTGEKSTDWFGVDDLDAAGARARELAETRCVWFGIATRRERLPQGKRGGREDCVVIVALWLDIDTAHPVHGQDNLPPDTETALEIVRRFPIPPTAINDTGHGIQPFWILEEPVEVAELGDTLARWHHTWTRLAEPYHLDNTSDVPRVLRVPGTVNRKAEPVPVGIIEADWSRLHGITELVDQLDELPEPEPAKLRRDPGEGLPGQDYNARHDGDELLVEIGCTLDHTDRSTGDRHYRRPGRNKGETGATVYANDGHTTIYSETLAQRHGLEVQRPYDPFGLYATIHHNGDHRAAAQALAADGYGSDGDADFLALISPELRGSVGSNGSATDKGGEGPAERRRMVLTPASSIKPRRVRWMWDGRWAAGSFGLLGGREGLGKSSVTADIAASVTRGTLAGEYEGEPRAVLICATEDSWAHTIVPRLIAAGADLNLVYRIDVLSADDIQVGLSLPRDTHEIEMAVEQTGAVLLVLDPLLSRLSETLDSHKDAEVRRALEPLTAVAERTNLFVLGLIHLNKGSGTSEVLDRLMGSRAFTAVARSVSAVIADPDDETERLRLFGTPKNNLGRSDLPSLSFTMEGFDIDTDDGPATVGRVNWAGETTTSIRDAMTRSEEDTSVRTAIAEAVDWLKEYMELYGPKVPSKRVKSDARAAGHSDKTLAKARTRLGLQSVSRPNTFPRETDWAEPGAVAPVVPIGPRGEE